MCPTELHWGHRQNSKSSKNVGMVSKSKKDLSNALPQGHTIKIVVLVILAANTTKLLSAFWHRAWVDQLQVNVPKFETMTCTPILFKT
mmetsp:Transcript_41945/g.72671  ORF Transcript_41945/g.72671 Transcript_41945/m.72671 type:complete len:88 (+) Transcript_41945:194-457(+)